MLPLQWPNLCIPLGFVVANSLGPCLTIWEKPVEAEKLQICEGLPRRKATERRKIPQ